MDSNLVDFLPWPFNSLYSYHLFSVRAIFVLWLCQYAGRTNKQPRAGRGGLLSTGPLQADGAHFLVLALLLLFLPAIWLVCLLPGTLTPVSSSCRWAIVKHNFMTMFYRFIELATVAVPLERFARARLTAL